MEKLIKARVMNKKKDYRQPETDYVGCALHRAPAEVNTAFEELLTKLF